MPQMYLTQIKKYYILVSNIFVVLLIAITEATMISTLEDALKRIDELELKNGQLELKNGQLELENVRLKEELAVLKGRNYGGRKKHNDAWMQSYNDFAAKYDGGMSIVEIVAEGEISRRTAYRYKAYYDELKNGNNI